MDVLDTDVPSRGIATAMRQCFPVFLAKSFRFLNPGTPFFNNWHIGLISEYLEACRRRELQRLIINLPPRSLKSTCVSVAWPAYLLGKNPAERIMTASYASALSVKHSLDCRHVLQSGWYKALFPDAILSKDQNEKQKFTTTQFGHRIATSVGGSATGEGGNVLIVDDPQNPAQMLGDATRHLANDWFDHTFASRLDDKRNGVIVVVMQRLHAEDLTGHLLAKGGWEHLKLPAIEERDKIYQFGRSLKKRKEGELLHPAREDESLIARAKRELGSFVFAAQYQQNPLPLEGGMLRREWMRRFRTKPMHFKRIVQSWDTAIKAGNQHDASVCMTFGETEEGCYVLDVQQLRLEYPELKRSITQLAADWEPDTILMEDKASGQSLLQDLKRETNLPFIAIQPVYDKVTRFAAASAMIEAGRVWFPQDASWLAALEQELLSFPKAPHDDQVDALSQYLNWLRKKASSQLQIRRI